MSSWQMIDLPVPLNVAVSDIHSPCLSIEGDLRKSYGRDLFNWGNGFGRAVRVPLVAPIEIDHIPCQKPSYEGKEPCIP